MSKAIAALISVFVTLLATPAVAQDDELRPSFDCAAATLPVEALICGDVELAELDAELGTAYTARLAALDGNAQAALRQEQRSWSANRGAVCGVEAEPAIEVDDAIGCLMALYRARLDVLEPGAAKATAGAASSGYGWLMGEWRVAGVRAAPADAARAALANGWVGRSVTLAEAPIVTLRGDACSLPRYHAEPAAGPEFGDLSQYPTAVMVRVMCVGVALIDLVRLTDDQMLLSEGEAVLELVRRR
jgi:uncharacterized protein YecT (DUF1311 family)